MNFSVNNKAVQKATWQVFHVMLFMSGRNTIGPENQVEIFLKNTFYYK